MEEERITSRRPFQIEIGATAARCERCRCEHFMRSPETMDSVRCLACGLEYAYTALLRQIAAAANQRTQELLSKAEALQEELQHSLRK